MKLSLGRDQKVDSGTILIIPWLSLEVINKKWFNESTGFLIQIPSN
jgi:hypothetical protein